jgi:hypothetical protein
MVWKREIQEGRPAKYTFTNNGFELTVTTYGTNTPAIGWWFIAKKKDLVYNSVLHGHLYDTHSLAIQAAQIYAKRGKKV